MAVQPANADEADGGSGKTSTDSSTKAEPSSNTNGICGGDMVVSAEKPSAADIQSTADLPILDVDGNSHPFKTLYTSAQGPHKALIIFIRHFFCGVRSLPPPLSTPLPHPPTKTKTHTPPQNCQEYIRTLAASIPAPSLHHPSAPSLVIVGCGQPDLIPMYAAATACRFPIYADPTRALYDRLGMTRTLELGPHRPDYIKTSLLTGAVKSVCQGVMSGRGALKGGDFKQVGGEFWFVDGEVKWCHRMRNTRDHAEVEVLRGLLGLEG